MTNSRTDRKSPTLDDVIKLLPRASYIPKRTHYTIKSCVLTFCKCVGVSPENFPLDSNILRGTLAAASPSNGSISGKRWSMLKSNTRRAIRIAGCSSYLELNWNPLPDTWENIVRLAPSSSFRSALRRFARFCHIRGILPENVSAEIVYQYGRYLEIQQHSPRARRAIRDLASIWTSIATEYPMARLFPVLISDFRQSYAIKIWHEVSAPLAKDVESYFRSRRSQLFLCPRTHPPLRDSTIATQDATLRRLVAAEIASGVRRDQLLSLADVVNPCNLRCGVEFLINRNQGRTNRQIFDSLSLAAFLSKNWVLAPESQTKTIRLLLRKVRIKSKGLTEKNRLRLHQFSSQKNVSNLANLPAHVMSESIDKNINRRLCLQVQSGVALAILLAAPIRVSNLARLDRHRHFEWVNHGDHRRLHLILPKNEVKNGIDLEYSLSSGVSTLLDHYMSEYQPILAGGTFSRLVFPGVNGGSKSAKWLGIQISRMVHQRLGIEFNAHLVRHLAALLFLTRNPGDYRGASRLLGHRDTRSTIRNYCGLEAEGVTSIFDQLIVTRLRY